MYTRSVFTYIIKSIHTFLSSIVFDSLKLIKTRFLKGLELRRVHDRSSSPAWKKTRKKRSYKGAEKNKRRSHKGASNKQQTQPQGRGNNNYA